MGESVQAWLYAISQFETEQVRAQLTHLSLLSGLVVFGAGLLTSLTPCMLSMLPITIGYIGGYEAQGRGQAALQSLWFALGLATTLALMGVIAAIAGGIYGQVGYGLPLIVSAIAILMGLNLLNALPLPLPAFDSTSWIPAHFPKGVKSYCLGLTFGLVASPCSTPVLATLLTWIAASQDPLLGGGLLLAYTGGYVVPLILAGTFTASLKKVLALRQWSGWITPTSGILLVGFGVFSLVSRLV